MSNQEGELWTRCVDEMRFSRRLDDGSKRAPLGKEARARRIFRSDHGKRDSCAAQLSHGYGKQRGSGGFKQPFFLLTDGFFGFRTAEQMQMASFVEMSTSWNAHLSAADGRFDPGSTRPVQVAQR